MKTVLTNLRYWVAGVMLASCGLMLAKKVGPDLVGSAQVITVLAGQFLAIGGLIVISVGVSRRIRRERTRGHQP